MKNKFLYDGDKFEQGGRLFRVQFSPEGWDYIPWKEDDGHGIVRESNNPHYDGQSDKQPGERPLNQADRWETQFYYDWSATMKKARREGWGLSEEDQAALSAKLGRPATKGEIIAEAVSRDYKFLRGFVRNDWEYMTVSVTLLNEDEEETDYSDSIGCVETFKDYHVEMAEELADQINKNVSDDETAARIEAKRARRRELNRFNVMIHYPDKSRAILSHKDKTVFSKRTAKRYAAEFADKHGMPCTLERA